MKVDKNFKKLKIFNNLMLCLFSAIAYYKRALYYLNVVFNLMFNGCFFWVKCNFIVVIFFIHIITITLIMLCEIFVLFQPVKG